MNDTDFWQSQRDLAREGEIVLADSPLTKEQIEIAWDTEIIRPDEERIPIHNRADLYRLQGLIDGGYISFIYGSRKNNFGGWSRSKLRYKNFIILMDSGGVRSEEYPEYKSRRNERRDLYDYMKETYERVKFLRMAMKSDPMINTAMIEGYEADDLIALLFLKGIGTDHVIAQDKDFFMIENLGPVMTDHSGVPQFYRGLKLPNYAVPPNKPCTYALTQAIFGDKSDSIPRLLPSNGWTSKKLYAQLIKEAPDMLTVFWNCLAQFGDQFIINLRLVLLPHPTMSNVDYSDASTLLVDLASNEYWNPDNYDNEILDAVVDSIKRLETEEW